MNNIETIKKYREVMEGEDEPHVTTWMDMAENLCTRLEDAEACIKNLRLGKIAIRDENDKLVSLQG